MNKDAPIEVLQEAISAVDRLVKILRKVKTNQIRSKEELQIIRATALAWFNNYRKQLETADTKIVEVEYSNLLEFVSKATSRDKYLELLKKIKKSLISLQSQILSNPIENNYYDIIPDFSPLAPSPQMQSILMNRWSEIGKCINSEAPLAATIMMGGLLEALFLALINKISDKSPVFKAKAAPKDFKTGKTLPLNEWTLSPFIDVATELKWITKPIKEVSSVLRNYRNFIHPERELSTGITLEPDDARIFWSVFIELAQQIITKAKNTN